MGYNQHMGPYFYVKVHQYVCSLNKSIRNLVPPKEYSSTLPSFPQVPFFTCFFHSWDEELSAPPPCWSSAPPPGSTCVPDP